MTKNSLFYKLIQKSTSSFYFPKYSHRPNVKGIHGFSFILATVKDQPAVLKMYASKSLQQLSEIGPLINTHAETCTHIITQEHIALLHIHSYTNVKS